MPLSLIYELGLNKAEAGEFEGATALFQHRFFGREEGGTNVRQVWVEIKLEQIQSLAKSDHCKEASAETATISKPVAGLDFTQNGLDPFLDSTRTKYLLADAHNSCGEKSEASAAFKQIASETELSNLFWANQAAKHLDHYDFAQWMARLNSAISQAEQQAQRSNSKVWWTYIAATLRLATGQSEAARSDLRNSLLLPDSRMAHHYIRIALSDPNLR
jgi:hypothetical protein